jgi:hypothetical protein
VYLPVSDPVVICIWHVSVNVFRFISQLTEHAGKVRLDVTMAMNVKKRMWRVAHFYCLQPQHATDAILKLPNANKNVVLLVVISGFRLKVNEKCYFLGYYAASSGNFLTTVSFFKFQESKIPRILKT